MENRLAIVIVIDGLRASALGVYGNTVSPTPQLDEVASKSIVIEWLLSNGSKKIFYSDVFASLSLKGMLSKCALMTDDPSVAEQLSGDFGEVLLVETGVEQSASDISSTHAAQLFALAIDQLSQRQARLGEGGLFWIHFSGLCGPWDAPLEMRAELMDEDDPLPPEFVAPPVVKRDVDDVDELLGYRTSYAAQVAVLDSCLGGFLEALSEIATAADKLVILTSSSGFALGEHSCVGHECEMLFSENLHLPGLLLTKETVEPLPRVTGFARPEDIGATLGDWLSTSPKRNTGKSLLSFLNGEPGHLRDTVIVENADERMIRTRAWQLNVSETTKLYVKPDDRWEANDVASRCGDVVDAMLALNSAGEDAELSEDLTRFWR